MQPLHAPTSKAPSALFILHHGLSPVHTMHVPFPTMCIPSPLQDGAAANPEDDSKFDEFMGNDAGALASTGQYDEDDKEADEIWEAVDTFMDERRRVRGALPWTSGDG